MTDVFNTPAETPNANETDLSLWVGEGKKYTNPDDLAKAYTHADRHIKNVEQENQQLREELDRRLSAEELLARARSQPVAQPAPAQPAAEPVKALSDEELVNKIRAVSEQQDEKKRATSNLDEVGKRMTEHFGDSAKAAEVVRNKAAELGVPVAWLQETAARSPKAFYSYFNLEAPAQTPQPSANREINSEAFRVQNPQSGQSRPGTYRYYEELRKSNPRQYFSPAVQNQMHGDAAANPNFWEGSQPSF